ncbi:VWA domain-containing protein [Chitinispirillales bacterium ANBcel5]|uniref:choice-of-anchor X domain-containing protein n=1 Tax=Cellulosispirillum alkaliphilum TaxID=3039283 RepID=UPI002A503F1A|nr:VWA domain-containing protein [Chitinispirillales bacterium ANBcel5]
MAHEFAHYAYGLYDQHPLYDTGDNEDPPAEWLWYPRLDDDTTISIMSYPINAYGGNYEWLNFDAGTYTGYDNAQGRMWDETGWNVLVRDPEWDMGGHYELRPHRVNYSSILNTRAPSPGDTWSNPNNDSIYDEIRVLLDTISNPHSTYLKYNNGQITWMDNDIELILIIDRSGSMTDIDGCPDGISRLDRVKSASKDLVSFLPVGRASVGITTFSNIDDDITELPMTAINDSSDIETIEAAIDGITADYLTALFDGAIYGLGVLNDYDHSNAIRIAMLLSDGQDNQSRHTGTTIQDVIDAYEDSKVPLFTFGYGPEAGRDTLEQLGRGTGGDFYVNITGENLLYQAYTNAVSKAAGKQELSWYVRSDGKLDFYIEPHTSSIDVSINTSLNGADSDDIEFIIRDQYDAEISPEPNTVSVIEDDGLSTRITISEEAIVNHHPGMYNLEIVISNPDIEVKDKRFIRHSDTDTDEGSGLMATNHTGLNRVANFSVNNFSGSTLEYPEPLLITASTMDGQRITDLRVSAILKGPDGETVIEMYDDGTNGDAVAQDGIYSAIYSGFEQDGDYTLTVTADNFEETAMLTTVGQVFSAGATSSPGLTPYDKPFGRQKTIRFEVTGVVEDDHGSCPATATPLTPDNAQIAGIINYASDEDFFSVNKTGLTDDILIRVSNFDPAMNPEITVFGSDESTIIAYTNIHVGSSGHGYLMIRIPSTIPDDQIFIRVNDLNPDSYNLTYRVSAGTEIPRDVAAGSSIEVYVKDEGLHENNIVKPRMYLKNTGDEPISNFTVCYYITAEDGKTPVISDYHTPYSNLTLIHLNGNEYRVDYSYSVTLEPGQMVPDQSGSVIGIHYEDWAPWNKLNDFSNPDSSDFFKTDRIAVFSSDGVLISGSFPLE